MKEVLNNIGFDWQVALANFVNFLIIFWVLKKWVFGPVGKILETRQKTIEAGVSQAENAKEQLAQAQTQVEEELKHAKAQANETIAKAQTTANEIVDAAANTAEQKAQAILDDAQAQTAKDRAQAEKDLGTKTAHLVAMGVQKILDEELSPEQNERVTKRALDIMKNA